MEFIKAIIFGIIEGITEWLPISSTGHMILLNQWLQMHVRPEFWEIFLVVIQLGAIFAVIFLYFNEMLPFEISLHNSIKFRPDTVTLWLKTLTAVLPAIIVALPLDDTINALFYTPLTVSITLIAYGILFILIEHWNKNKTFVVTDLSQITFPMALFIGIFQLLALIPGTSRSGATIIGAMLLGISREAAAKFTFYLAVPVMLGASVLKLAKYGFAFTANEAALLLTGMAAACIVSLIVIRFLMNFIKKHSFRIFGYYRILLGILVFICFH